MAVTDVSKSNSGFWYRMYLGHVVFLNVRSATGSPNATLMVNSFVNCGQVWLSKNSAVRLQAIITTDQGSQFTSQEFTAVLLGAGIAISMNEKGAWRDNVFVERLWRSIKYEEIYLPAYGSVGEAQASIGRCLTVYNGRTPHSSLDRRTPDKAYFDRLPRTAAT